jgi:hypothetical protein
LEFQTQSESINFEILDHVSLAKFEKFQYSSADNHNFSISNLVNMDNVGDDDHTTFIASVQSRITQDMQDMNTLFESIKHHITHATQQLSGDFQQDVDSNSKFKQEVQDELKEMPKVLADQKRLLGTLSSSSPVTASTASSPGINISPPLNSSTSVSLPNVSPPLQASGISTTSVSQDMNAQILMLLSNSFSKLSSALPEKLESVKSDWPKFSGDQKKFRSWYLSIMAQLSLPPRREFYDSSKNDVILTTSNSVLNGKLYSKLLLSLEGMALQSIVAKKHLRANGLSLLQDLVQIYKPKNVPEVIAAKTSEFWGTMKSFPSETVDAYFNRFHELLDDLNDATDPITPKSAICNFIFTLGPEFEAIQNNYCIGNLPPAWQTDNWPNLLILCRDYYNSVKPLGMTKEDSSSNFPGVRMLPLTVLAIKRRLNNGLCNQFAFVRRLRKNN